MIWKQITVYIQLETDEKKRAIVKESLRLSYGVPGCLPRVVPPSGAVLCGHEVPPGVGILHLPSAIHDLLTSVYLQTIVSSSNYVYHQDPHTFHDPEAFRPERWLAESPGDLREMERNFFPFSRGSRSCIGSNLAHAELNLTLAHLFRRFDISNHGTSERDMQWDDCFSPVTKGHLMVMLKDSAD